MTISLVGWVLTPMTDGAVCVVPANEAGWEELQTIFGTRGDPSRCQCQWFKIRDLRCRSVSVGESTGQLREQSGWGNPGARTTSGLVAYLDGEPAGWCAVEARTAYARLLRARVPWTARPGPVDRPYEDKADAGVWALTCFVTRTGFRRRGISRALAHASVDFARSRGARSIEGYPIITQPGQAVTWGELYVGSRSIFADAEFAEARRDADRFLGPWGRRGVGGHRFVPQVAPAEAAAARGQRPQIDPVPQEFLVRNFGTDFGALSPYG